MSGSRRIQRSVRLTVACSLLVLTGVLVAAAVVTSTLVSAAAVLAVVVGAVAARIGYAEVISTRQLAAIDRATQSRAFGALLAEKQGEHTAFARAMTRKVQGQQRTITGLEGTVRLAERRADEAETRVQTEARRAREAQERLSSLLDEVLMHQPLSVVPDGSGSSDGKRGSAFDSADLPTVIDLLAWEDQANGASSRNLRRQA